MLHPANQRFVACSNKMARQLKGPVKKETAAMRRDRKKENAKAKERVWSVALPVLIVVILIVVIIILLSTRVRGDGTH